MQSDIKKRSLWELAEVTELIKSKADGKIRGARLRTKEGETTRPLQKLYPLLDAEQLRPNSVENQQESIEKEASENIEQEETEDTEQEAENVENNESDDVNIPNTQPGTTEAAQATSNQPDLSPSNRPSRASKTAAREFLQKVSQDLLEDD